MLKQYIAGATGRYGHKGYPGQRKHQRFLPDLIGICGWVQRKIIITSRIWCRSTGGAGGILEPAHWETWAATLSDRFSKSSILDIQHQFMPVRVRFIQECSLKH